MDILVFKTNILKDEDVEKIASGMNDECRIKHWTIDREDCDKVLRIESHTILPDEVVALIEKAGYSCEELTY